MKKIQILFLTILISKLSYTQNDYNFVGAGARQAGMGYAFIGVADDATALSSNPAGLSQLRKPEISIAGRLTGYNHTEKRSPDDGYDYDYKNTKYSLNFASIALPLNLGSKRIVLGLSFQNQIDQSYSYHYTFVRPTSTSDISADAKTKISTINIGAAFNLNAWFSFGFAVNKWFSTGDFQNISINTTTNYISTSETDNRNDYNGVNYIFGTLISFEHITSNFPLKLGLKIATPFDLKNKRGISAAETNYDLTTSTFTRDAKGSTSISNTLQFPLIVGTGLSYKIGDYFTIACDYETRQFKDKKIIINTYTQKTSTSTDITFIGDTTYNVDIVPTNKNINQFRIGLEYILHPKFALIPLRIGYKTNPTLYADVKNNQPGDQILGKSINMGFGIVFKKISFDFAFEKYIFEQNYIATTTRSVDNSYNYFTFSTIYYFK